jgi:DNA-binding MarR family transcriptional regulator/GNAT superfamily N-acetyltransferase
MAALTPDSASVPDLTVQAVRRFNRFYTRQIGVLQEHLLRSQFSLTEVRVLYELAHRKNVTAIELREELGIDRGYLSRMLASFERNGWIRTTASATDRRRILLSLTAKGWKIFAPLDRRSSEEVGGMLARLSGQERESLLGAMREIEAILGAKGAGTEAFIAKGSKLSRRLQRKPSAARRSRHSVEPAYTLRAHRPGDMGWVVQRHGQLYWQEYRYDERFEAIVAEIVAKFLQNFDSARERCWIAERSGERLGAIFLIKKSQAVAKLRLLLVEPGARGLGIGKHLVSECVEFARQAGYKKIVLWTQSELHAARRLYQQAGFKCIAQKPHQSWGRTDLVSETWSLNLG